MAVGFTAGPNDQLIASPRDVEDVEDIMLCICVLSVEVLSMAAIELGWPVASDERIRDSNRACPIRECIG